MRLIVAGIFCTSLLAIAKADHDCPLCPIMEWEHKDATTGESFYYYTYYCDFYSGDCDEVPEGCSELTGTYPWPCITCGEDCQGIEGEPEQPAAPTPTVAKTKRVFPGLKSPVNAANPHKMPERGGGRLTRQIGPEKFVKILVPGESSPRSAYEYRYKIISKHDGSGTERRDIWLAFETTDPPPSSYPTYNADMADPHGAHWYMVDTGTVVGGVPKILLFLMD